MSLRHWRAIALSILAASSSAPLTGLAAQPMALPTTSNPLQTLLEQARFWAGKGDSLRAQELWEKLLLAQPNDPEALDGLVRASIAVRKPDAVASYLAQLRKAHPSSHFLAALEQDMRIARNPQALSQARSYARTGQKTQAITSYQALLAGKPPEGQFAVEYYDLLASTDAGWETAQAGLRRLVIDLPDNWRARVALARQLSYREASRREAIAQLEHLSRKDPALVTDWQKALQWLQSRKADLPLYIAYLRERPDDTVIAQRAADLGGPRVLAKAPDQPGQEAAFKEGNTQGVPVQQIILESSAQPPVAAPTTPARQPTAQQTKARKAQAQQATLDALWSPKPGFQALEQGDFGKAEAHFERLLTRNPRDRDALGGMGVLRMRQQRWDAAVAFLDQAIAYGAARQWSHERAIAAYQAALSAGQAALDRGDSEGALAQASAAERLNPQEPQAYNLRAAAWAAQGQHAQAQTAYRQVLVQHPRNTSAHVGLVTSLQASEGLAPAWAWVEQHPSVDWPVDFWKKLQAQRSLDKAQQWRLQTPQDLPAIRAALDDALERDGTNPWTRLAVARQWQLVGDAPQAQTVAAPLLHAVNTNPASPAAVQTQYAAAVWQETSRDWLGAMAALQRIPEASMPPAAAALAQRARAHLMLDDIEALLQHGQPAAAQAALDRLGSLPQDPAITARLARYFAQAGDMPRGLSILKAALATTPRDASLLLEYAGLQSQAASDSDAQSTLARLADVPLTPEQRQTMAQLQLSATVHQADSLRQAGQLNEARNLLVPLLGQHPTSAAVQSAWARLLVDEGQYASAWDAYQALLVRDPDNTELVLPAAQLALAQQKAELAQMMVEHVLDKNPRDAQALTVAGHIAHARGAQVQAMDYYSAALQVQPQLVTAQQGLDDLRAHRAPVLTLGMLVRSRQGEGGLGRLQEVEAPVQLQWGAGNGLVSLRITPVRADAGNAPAGSSAAQRFGNGASLGGAPGQQDNTGVGLSLSYTTRQWSVDVGTRPPGAIGATVLGGVQYATDVGADSRVALTLSRRMLTDSLLSMAGATDARTGTRWGATVATGARVDASHNLSDHHGLYGYAGLYRITGTQVLGNTRADIGAGWYRHLRNTTNERLTVGLFANVLGHSDNQRFFTVGHGGYFSPQQYLALSVPVEWSKRSGPLSYRLRGSVGVQHFSEDAAPVTPLSPLGSPAYAAQSVTGITYSASAAMEYQLSPQWLMGGKLGMESSRGFREWGGGIYMRYGWQPGLAPPAFPLESLESAYVRRP